MMICLHGSRLVVDGTVEELTAIAHRWNGHVLPVVEVQTFWRERHAATESFSIERQSLWSDTLPIGGRPPRVADREGSRYVHVSLPVVQVLEFRRWVMDIAEAAGLAYRESGIWGLPEFFSFIISGPSAVTDSVADQAILEAARRGGSIEYCHGIGLSRAHLMPAALGESWPFLQELKRVFDPSGMLNPGKQGHT